MAAVETMKVKLATGRVGHKFNAKGEHVGEFFQNAGDDVDMPVDEAQRYLDRGMASRIVETAKK